MQTLASRASAQRVAVAKKSTSGARSARPLTVVCQAGKASPVEKIQQAALVAASSFIASPAFALVDDRLAGEGTGRPLGINDPALGWVIAGMAGLIWTIWFTSQKDISADMDGNDFEDKDSGLKL